MLADRMQFKEHRLKGCGTAGTCTLRLFAYEHAPANRWRLIFFLLLHAAVWTVFAVLTLGSGSLHHDMTEAWAWGQEFQFGYHKHPPFFAWVAGLWFQVMPRADWSFYLLAMCNAGVGLAGVWMIAGRFLDGAERWSALLLVTLTPILLVQCSEIQREGSGRGQSTSLSARLRHDDYETAR
jgi:hypothetical protein